MGFDANKAQQDIVPSFKFSRVGDGVKLLITDIDEDVTIDDKFDGTLKGVGRFLAIKGEVLAAVGGNVNPETDEVTDVAVGESRSVLAQYEYKPTGSDSYSQRYSIIAKAIGKAIVESGATSLQVGGELIVKHSELGKRNTENPSWSRPKLYTASYTPPAKGSAALAAPVDVTAPF